MKKESKIKPRSKRFYIVLAVAAALATMTLKFIGLQSRIALFFPFLELLIKKWFSRIFSTILLS